MPSNKPFVPPLLAALAAGLALVPAARADFDADFTGATLRVDYVHTGTANEEHFALDRVRIEGPWPGSRTQLLDTTNLGKYLLEVADLADHRVLYSRGFASIYGEWETTGEAADGVWRAIEEAVRIPEPRRPFQLRLRKRRPDQSFAEVWSLTVDPASRFVDRAALTRREARALIKSGDPAVKVDLVILGDGYTVEQLEKYHADARRLADALFAAEPFASRKSDFNVWTVDSPSPESGISRPRAGQFRDSALGARYNTFDSERYILSLEDRHWRDVAAAAPYDFMLLLVNERQYGGGGIHNLYSTAAVDSAFAAYLVVHEFGHHFAGLGDEYYTSDVAYEDANAGKIEPWEPNVTAMSDAATLKWRDLVDPSTPLPTPWQKTEFEKISLESQERRRKLRAAGAAEEEVEKLFREEQRLFTAMLGGDDHAGKIGAFEGAMYEARGLYRPAEDCIMFTRDDVGFCAVCRRAIERVIDLYAK